MQKYLAIIRYAFRISKQEGKFSRSFFLAVLGYRKSIRLHYENVKDKLDLCVKDKLEPLARLGFAQCQVSCTGTLSNGFPQELNKLLYFISSDLMDPWGIILANTGVHTAIYSHIFSTVDLFLDHF